MSAWELGTRSQERVASEEKLDAGLRTHGELETRSQDRVASEEEPGAGLLTYVGRVLTWIPADVVALFGAVTMALVDEPKDAAGPWLIVGGAILSALFVVGGAWSRRGSGASSSAWFTGKLRWRTMLAPVAFLIWSPTVPGSGWTNLAIVAENPGWTVVACAAAGALFALFVSGLER